MITLSIGFEVFTPLVVWITPRDIFSTDENIADVLFFNWKKITKLNKLACLTIG